MSTGLLPRHHCLCCTDHEAVLQRLLVNLSSSETQRSALCLTLQPPLLRPKQLRRSGWVGFVRLSSQMSHQQWRVQLHSAFATLGPSGLAPNQPKQHLIPEIQTSSSLCTKIPCSSIYGWHEKFFKIPGFCYSEWLCILYFELTLR